MVGIDADSLGHNFGSSRGLTAQEVEHQHRLDLMRAGKIFYCSEALTDFRFDVLGVHRGDGHV